MKFKGDLEFSELEKHGFKPKYDEDNGSINRYSYGFEEIVKIYVKTRKISVTHDSGFAHVIAEVIYKITKAGLLED